MNDWFSFLNTRNSLISNFTVPSCNEDECKHKATLLSERCFQSYYY